MRRKVSQPSVVRQRESRRSISRVHDFRRNLQPHATHFQLVSTFSAKHNSITTMNTSDATTRQDPDNPNPQPTRDITPLSDDASPDEKDLHWFTHVYAGDKQKQL